jgi:hypothetical protein
MSGVVTTVTSYRKGVGRTLTAANLAWMLASGGSRVLAVDWSFDAPRLAEPFHPFWPDRDPRNEPGVIDGLWEYVLIRQRSLHAAAAPLVATVPGSALALDWQFPGDGRLEFLNVGRSASYAMRNQLFPWRAFFEELSGQAFIEDLGRSVRQRFDHVVVDAPVVLEDWGGICTALLPDHVVLCLATGGHDAAPAAESIRHVRNAISGSARDRPVQVIPVLTRTERTELSLLVAAKERIREQLEGLEGVAPDLPDLEVPDLPFLHYQEAIAMFLVPQAEDDPLYGAYAAILSEVLGRRPAPVPALRAADRAEVMRRYASPPAPPPPSPRRSLFGPAEIPRPFDGHDGYVFVSYAREDFDRIVLTIDQIQQLGYRAWWDTGIEPGATWRDILGQRLRRCSGVVLFASARASRSEWVKWELAEARRLGKRVLPVKMDDIDELSEVGLLLAGQQYVPDPGTTPSPALEVGLRRLLGRAS